VKQKKACSDTCGFNRLTASDSKEKEEEEEDEQEVEVEVRTMFMEGETENKEAADAGRQSQSREMTSVPASLRVPLDPLATQHAQNSDHKTNMSLATFKPNGLVRNRLEFEAEII